MYHEQLGNHEKATAVIDHVLNSIIPELDPTNTLGNFEIILPLLKVLKPRGEAKKCYDLFYEHVEAKFQKYHGPEVCTPSKFLHKPILWLFAMRENPNGFEAFEEAVEYFAEDGNGMPLDFLDRIMIKSCWGASDLFAELCMLLARRLELENGDLEVRKKM